MQVDLLAVSILKLFCVLLPAGNNDKIAILLKKKTLSGSRPLESLLPKAPEFQTRIRIRKLLSLPELYLDPTVPL